MPRINFGEIDDMDDFSPIPEGQYRVRLDEIEETETKNGDCMWKLRWIITSGEHIGRIIFDNMVFSRGGKPRVKFMCSRMGLDVSGELDLTPDLIQGREVLVRTEIDQYEDRDGKERKIHKVRYYGYECISSEKPKEDEGGSRTPEEDLPF